MLPLVWIIMLAWHGGFFREVDFHQFQIELEIKIYGHKIKLHLLKLQFLNHW